MQAVLDDWTTAPVPERTRAALRLLECMTTRPLELDAPFVAALYRDGLDEPAIREAANVAFHYNFINRVADAFDYPIPDGDQTARLAGLLNLMGKLMKGSFAETVWVRGEDGRIRPTEIERGWQQMLSAPGKTERDLRIGVGAYVAEQWGRPRVIENPVPVELVPYLKKLAVHAYKVTDEDLDALRQVGYDDEAIYEITIVGAFGSALVGLEQLFEVLHGKQTDRPITRCDDADTQPNDPGPGLAVDPARRR